MNLEDLGGKVAGGLEVIFHHPLKPLKDYHYWVVDPNTGANTCCRGSWPDDADLAWLAANKVDMVVNLCLERNQDAEVRGWELNPINVPILDGSAPTTEQAEYCLGLLADNLCYFHCEAGHGRTGCIIAYIRIKKHGYSVQEALGEALFIAGHLEPNQVKWIQEIT